MRRFLFVLICLCFFSGLAGAHTRSQSSSSWQVENNRLLMTFTVDAYRATLLASFGWDALSPSQMLAKHLPVTIKVAQNGSSCSLLSSSTVDAVKGKLRHQMIFECASPVDQVSTTASIGAFFSLSASHQHIFYAQLEDGEPIERILTDGHSTVNLNQEAQAQDLLSLVKLGFGHVLSGLDHLFFLGALVLLCHGWRQTVLLISCFTLGHMVSLYLVAINWISPVSFLIEALIGLSIAALALAALAQKYPLPKQAPIFVSVLLITGAGIYGLIDGFPVYWAAFLALILFVFFELTRLSKEPKHSLFNTAAITLLFSLAHGAGFAGGLLKAGFQETALIQSVLLFNIGVELGQILAAAAFFTFLSILTKISRPIVRERTEVAIILVLIWIGSYYFFARLF